MRNDGRSKWRSLAFFHENKEKNALRDSSDQVRNAKKQKKTENELIKAENFSR